MAKAARERLARLLAGEEAVAFSAQLSVPSDTLHLEVDGVGRVRLPVRPAQAKKLSGVARPAHFGHREETILDPAVRDTWEISPDLVSLGGPSWAPALEGALTQLADELGVPAGNRLEAEPAPRPGEQPPGHAALAAQRLAQPRQTARPLGSTRITGLRSYCGPVRQRAPRRYSAPRGFCRLARSLSPPYSGGSVGATPSHVPYESLARAHAACMPDAAWAVNGFPPD
jgi:hypothetical protein